jgi:hypothetical protein
MRTFSAMRLKQAEDGPVKKLRTGCGVQSMHVWNHCGGRESVWSGVDVHERADVHALSEVESESSGVAGKADKHE